MTAHAPLSPSAAHRWMACPASHLATQHIEDAPSLFAEEGSLAHEFAAAALTGDEEGLPALLEIAETEGWDGQEMLDHATEYASLVRDWAGDRTVLVEQRVDTGIPDCWGTADAVIIGADLVHVVDYKYGRGVRVDARDNPQMKLYGLGALQRYRDIWDPPEVRLTIHQPRIGHTDSATLSSAELLGWKGEVLSAARLAQTEDAPFRPSAEACRFCPLSGKCRAQTEWILAQPTTHPAELTPEAMAEALERVPLVKRWAEDVEGAAHELADAGRLPGWKLVRSGSRRVIRDETEALQALLAEGLPEVTETKLVGLGKLDKIAGGKEKLAAILGDALGRTEGRLALARDDDPREGESSRLTLR